LTVEKNVFIQPVGIPVTGGEDGFMVYIVLLNAEKEQFGN